MNVTMGKNAALLCAVLAGAVFAASGAISQQAEQPEPKAAPPVEKVCLQNNRMMNYDVIDDHTLRITDRFFKNYTVRMSSGCVGLTPAAMDVVLRAHTSLGCLGQGDTVTFRSPGLGRLSCFIISVENYVPPKPKEG